MTAVFLDGIVSVVVNDGFVSVVVKSSSQLAGLQPGRHLTKRGAGPGRFPLRQGAVPLRRTGRQGLGRRGPFFRARRRLPRRTALRAAFRRACGRTGCPAAGLGGVT